jgi:hypothetical protein
VECVAHRKDVDAVVPQVDVAAGVSATCSRTVFVVCASRRGAPRERVGRAAWPRHVFSTLPVVASITTQMPVGESPDEAAARCGVTSTT